MEIFAKVSDIDGSSNLQYHFRLDDEEQLLEVDLIPSDEKVLTEEESNEKKRPAFIG